jgi:S-DNA-T family DNA segregation ATPase FtsK/SpoIIIE
MAKNRKVRRPERAKGTPRTPVAPDRPARAAGPRAHEGGRSREIVGIVSLGMAIFLCLALLSLQLGTGTFMGPFGRTIATFVYGLAGICSHALVAMIAVAAVRLLRERAPIVRLPEAIGLVLGVVTLGSLLHLAAADYRLAGYGPGGVVGEHVAEVLRALLSTAGTVLLALTGLFIAVVIATPLRVHQVGAVLRVSGRFLWAGIAPAGVAVGRFFGDVVRAVLPEREHDEYLDDEDDAHEPFDAFAHEGTDPGLLDPPIISHGSAPAGELGGDTERFDEDELAARIGVLALADAAAGEAGAGKRARKRLKAADGSDEGAKPGARPEAKPGARIDARPEVKPGARIDDAAVEGLASPANTIKTDMSKTDMGKAVAGKGAVDADDDVADEIAADAAAIEAAVDRAAPGEEPDADAEERPRARKQPALALVPPVQAAAGAAPAGAADGEQGPVIVESRFSHQSAQSLREKEKQMDAERLDFIPLGGGKYQLPALSLLQFDGSGRSSMDRSSMLEMSAKLTQTLENYGVKGEVVAIRPGPVVTMYEFAPAPGTRVSKISNLSDDLAMALEALSVRIVAPIPGKGAVGIEVPNRTRETVYLKEVLADDVFQKGKHKLPLSLGKDIEGAPSLVDLAKMPHLLVAGTTGSGKSVAVNSMITSLLYSRTPEEVRMIMVDPKMLELSIYEGIPHLLLPVVTDPKKANLALRWGVEEMERRYDLLASMGVRDLDGYNKKVARLRAQAEADKLKLEAEVAQRRIDGGRGNDDGDDDWDEDAARAALAAHGELPREMPYIVIIIDEFADLMMCAPKEVETSVARIAQKARAAGLHLILATQRPSVDVITGLIKANFPSRAAFRVASKVDSRTILDQGGAEALLGSGDMLFCDRGASPVRYHGCFVDEEEIARVVDVLKKQGKPVYNMDILKPREEDEDEGAGGGDDDDIQDDMYDRAVALVAETQQASISMIQRRLRVGYNRAARMVEQMEREGVVSAPDHTNKREVLVQPAA